MVQREHSLNRIFLLATAYCCFVVAISSCVNESTATTKLIQAKDYTIDTTGIPKDTVLGSDQRLAVLNGIYLLNNKKYSGILKELYPNGTVKTYASVYQGRLHGRYKSFYENGHPYEVRLYRNNLSTGRHYGYWPERGILKFDYTYFDEKREGQQKRWYKNGKPYLFTTYTDDHEDGLQQGWRENGKLYLNYVAKDGHRYGLQQAALCYTLRKQKIKSQ
ncbi:hypothetical protein EXU85_12220 [Spirosoma sp. KCTC 42546]|uniref:toxin-antitoxin system YwqK family antitoxin n=1 Tax=Spirosoma sp. KCTC 42546 TaxID=2520506 RepID=UPI00115872C4|nr:hypothetical protein [Spirosoma sp. KCTC 42546]QDK79324.1 hypothetical protein EXU85_12220 [Spirosoma sp. KCTC 42546]